MDHPVHISVSLTCRAQRRACALCAPTRSSSSGGSRSASAWRPPTAAQSHRTEVTEGEGNSDFDHFSLLYRVTHQVVPLVLLT